MTIIDEIRDYLDQDKSVRRVADDVQLTSELILLVRMMFADGRLAKREMANFTRICETAFGIPATDVPGVIAFLKETGYETSAEEAAGMFENMPMERKVVLLSHMYEIARSDDELHSDEIGMIRRIASILGMTADDLARITS